MCYLCNNIKKIEEYKVIESWDRYNTIVQKQNKAFGL